MQNNTLQDLPNNARRLLGELDYLYHHWARKKGKDFQGCFFCSDEKLRFVLKISRCTLKRARKKLLSLGLIEQLQGGKGRKATTYSLPNKPKLNTTQNETQKENTSKQFTAPLMAYVSAWGENQGIEMFLRDGGSQSKVDEYKKG